MSLKDTYINGIKITEINACKVFHRRIMKSYRKTRKVKNSIMTEADWNSLCQKIFDDTTDNTFKDNYHISSNHIPSICLLCSISECEVHKN